MATGVGEVVAALREDRRLGPQVAEALYLPAVEARFGEPEPALPAVLRGALAGRGVERLWSHQAAGLTALRGGEDVLITTPTASGKSLVFHLPVLEEASVGGPGRALFLYPLKALGQDQKGKFERLAAAAGLGEAAACEIYDGDTSQSVRRRIRQKPPRVVVSNPDMLHLGILSFWPSWEPFLRELRWIVLDELHTYRGIFGSHFHHTLQRLFRVCASLGSAPRLVASSATAGNADAFAAALTGRPFRWIADSGAPRQGRHLLLVRPDASPYTTSLQLAIALLESGLKTIVFTKARRITELLYSWLKQQAPGLARRVRSYRSGFLPEERRRIERGLFEGRLDGVISTSALEMGIDVGGLDACVLVGYPGSVMATWQRSGRVGRAGNESLTAMVALPDALDQYFLEHPDELVGRPCERLIVDPENEPVTRAHLECAAAEMPLSKQRDADYLARHAPVVGDLLREHRLAEAADGSELYARRRRPQRGVGLRGAGDTSTILDAGSGRVVGTVDGVRVLHECHPGAVYLHAGRQYLVVELDLERSKVHARPVRLDYFTTPLTEKETEILEVLEERREGPLTAWLGRLEVTERVVGYERQRIRGREVLDQHELDLPPVSFETVGLWWAAPRAVEETLRSRREHFMGSLHAAEHAAISLLPVLAVCDRGDVGGVSIPLHPQVRCGAVFVYDGHAGGVGIAARAFRELPELLERVLALLESCPCEIGCPSCVQSPKCGNGNRPLDKSGAARLVRLLLDREAPLAAWAEAPPPLPPRERAALELAGPLVATPGRVVPPFASGTPASSSGPGTSERPPPAEFARRTSMRGRSPEALLPGAPPSDLPLRDAPTRESPPQSPLSRAPGRVLPPAPAPRTAFHPRRPRPRRTVLFDLETRRSAAEVGGWGRAYRMLVAVGVVLHLEKGRFETFFEDRVGELIARLEAADLVVGFNVERFDYRVLSGYTGIDYRRRLPTLDLLQEIRRGLGFRLGLDHLARETLQVGKQADGLQSLEWVREGRLDLVAAYCRSDVEILRDLYLFGRRMGYLLYRDKQERKVKLPVDW